MAISPINYMINQPDIGESLKQGLEIGNAIKANRLADEERAYQLQQREAAEQFKLKYQEDLKSTFDNPTPKNIAMLISNYPQQREAFKQSFDLMSDEQKKNETNIVGQVYSALTSGNNEVALKVINKEIEAVKNSNGDTKKLEGIRDSIETNPKGATLMAGLAYDALLGGKDFSKVVESQSSEQRKKELHPIEVKKAKADLKKLAIDMGLTKAQTSQAYANIKKINAETSKVNQAKKKLIFELEALKTGAVDGKITYKDTKELFEIEKKVRDDYKKQTAGYSEATRIADNINASANDKSGAGDIALVTSFMKMLDPGSVVRETEFATASDTDGLLSKLQSAAQKIENGQFLSPSQRTTFKNLANKYMQAAKKQADQAKKDTGIIVKNYQLNPENIFGASDEVEKETLDNNKKDIKSIIGKY